MDSSPLSTTQQMDSNSKDVQCQLSTCQQPADKKCAACKSVSYCSVEHQKLDWKNHKKVCQSFSIEKIEGMGLGWVATRDLKAGYTLLEEVPAIVTPSWKHSLGKSRASQEEVAYAMFMACMQLKDLKTRDPAKFKELMALQDYHSIPSSNEAMHRDIELPPAMFDMLTEPSSLTKDEIRKLLRICTVNSFEGEAYTTTSTAGDRPHFNQEIYLKVSRINHSCFANCTATFSPTSSGARILIRTAVPIPKGEQITINAFEVYGFEPTINRQLRIGTQGYICKCKRCLDRTELGTFLSGIKCSSCSSHLSAADSDDDNTNVGFFLPAHPLDVDKNKVDSTFEFACHRCQVKKTLAEIKADLPASVKNAFRDLQGLDLNSVDPKRVKSLLNKYAEDSAVKAHLHKNHWLIQRVMRMATKMLLRSLWNLSQPELNSLLKEVKFLLTVDDKLFPGVWHKPRLANLGLLSGAVTVLINNFGSKMNRQKLIELLQIGVKADKDQLDIIKAEMTHGADQDKSISVKFLQQAEAREKQLARLLGAKK